MKYRDVRAVLEAHGFVEVRCSGSHHQLKAMIGGQTRLVTLSYAQGSKDVPTRTMASIIRQSGLTRQTFR